MSAAPNTNKNTNVNNNQEETTPTLIKILGSTVAVCNVLFFVVYFM